VRKETQGSKGPRRGVNLERALLHSKVQNSRQREFYVGGMRVIEEEYQWGTGVMYSAQ